MGRHRVRPEPRAGGCSRSLLPADGAGCPAPLHTLPVAAGWPEAKQQSGACLAGKARSQGGPSSSKAWLRGHRVSMEKNYVNMNTPWQGLDKDPDHLPFFLYGLQQKRFQELPAQCVHIPVLARLRPGCQPCGCKGTSQCPVRLPSQEK